MFKFRNKKKHKDTQTNIRDLANVQKFKTPNTLRAIKI